MKSKIKKFINSKLFIFIITALVFSTIGVSAATYFESNLVTYDNTESGLTSTDVQGAIDELYNECLTSDPLAGTGLENIPIVTEGDGLYKDEYEEGRYIFKGGNPNNYITFNNETAGWRIISIEPDKTIKIMRKGVLGDRLWDTTSNDWARPAAINTYLSETYYNTLYSVAKSQIVAGNFSIGAVTWGNNDMSTQVSDENSNKWYGKVALPTISEYIRTNKNKDSCGTLSLMDDNSSSCGSTGWMNNDRFWWTLTPYSGDSSYVYRVDTYSGFYRDDIRFAKHAARPVVYLSSEVKIKGGSCSETDPCRIE